MEAEFPFIGRRFYLTRLEREWQQYRLFGIFGLRSVGKSRLVKEFILCQKQKHMDNGGILNDIWIDLRKSSSLRRIFMKLCEKLNIGNIGGRDDDLLSDICAKLVNEMNVVIVFDNSEDVIDNSKLCNEFKHICRSLLNSNCHIFITSTSEPEFINDFVCSKLDILPLSTVESEELLRVAAPSVDFGMYLESIVKLCEGLPLALLMIASELEDQDSNVFTLEEMVQLLTESRLEALSGEFYPKVDQIAPVYIRFLKRLTKHAQESLAVLGYIPGTFNIHQASEILDDPSETTTMITTLQPMTRSHVTEFDPISKRFDIQGILRDCIAVFMKIKNLPGVRKRFCFIFSAILQEIIQRFRTKQYMDALATFNVEHQNFQKLLTDVIYSTEDTYPVFIDLACKATGEIQYFMAREGFQFYEECIRLCVQNNMIVDEALVRVSYGAALTNIKGDLKNGEENYTLAINVMEKIQFTNSRYQLAFTYQRLGWNIGSQGKIQEALEILTKAWVLENELHLQHDTLILQTLNTLGIFHVYAGNFCASEKYHFESLKRRKQVYGTENHPFIGSVYNDIGELYRGMEDFKTADKYFKRGLEIKIQTKATDHAIVMSQTNVAMSLAQMGEYNQAFEILADANRRLSKYPGLYEDTVSLVSNIRGQLCFEQKQYLESSRYMKEALKVRRKVMPDSLGLVESLLGLGKSYIGMKKYKRAITALTEALNLKDSVFEMPTSTFISECFETCQEAYLALGDRHGLENLYHGNIQELCRLIDVYEDFGNRQKVEYYKNKLSHLETKPTYRLTESY